MTSVLRTIADGLIHKAEELPKDSRAAHHLRDAAASLLDADCQLEPDPSADLIPFPQKKVN